MNHQNIYPINKFSFFLLLIIFFTNCTESKDSFISELDCESDKDLELLIDDFNDCLQENNGFFSVLERKDNLQIEPYNSEYTYKEGNIKLSYNSEKNIFLIDESIGDIRKLDSVVMVKLKQLLNHQGKSINQIKLDDYKDQNSGLIFEVFESSSEKDKRITKSKSYSILSVLKELDCSINRVREKLAEIVLEKKYSEISQEERLTIHNIVPKIYYVIYLNDYKTSQPKPKNVFN